MQIYGKICPSCGYDKWDIWLADKDYFHKYVACCVSCTFERPYIKRKPRTNEITPSQQSILDKVERYVLITTDNIDYVLDKTIKLDEIYGDVVFIFKLKIPAINFYKTVVGSVGRRGKVSITDAYSYYTGADGTDLTDDFKKIFKCVKK